PSSVLSYFTDPPTPLCYPLSLHDALPICLRTYLVGRGLSRGAQACIGALLTIGVGLAVFPELRAALDERRIAWGWLHEARPGRQDRKSTRLNSSHRTISYAVFCLKKKKKE